MWIPREGSSELLAQATLPVLVVVAEDAEDAEGQDDDDGEDKYTDNTNNYVHISTIKLSS